jgi:hypothetical protein
VGEGAGLAVGAGGASAGCEGRTSAGWLVETVETCEGSPAGGKDGVAACSSGVIATASQAKRVKTRVRRTANVNNLLVFMKNYRSAYRFNSYDGCSGSFAARTSIITYL